MILRAGAEKEDLDLQQQDNAHQMQNAVLAILGIQSAQSTITVNVPRTSQVKRRAGVHLPLESEKKRALHTVGAFLVYKSFLSVRLVYFYHRQVI